MQGKIVLATELDTKSFENQIKQVEAELRMLEKRNDEIKNMKPYKGQEEDLKQLGLEIEKTGNKLIDLKKRQDALNQSELSNIPATLSNIGDSMSRTITKVGRWAGALIGVRTVYNGIRQAINMVSSQNEGISNQIQAMRNVVANALAPVVQTIVNLMAKLMVYANYIFKALTGRALFDFSKATQGASDNLKSGAKSAKEINKQLAGFDEMNVLQSSTSSAGGGGGAGGMSGIDTSLFDIEKPAWIQWIEENKDLILATLAGLAAALIALKVIGLDPIVSLGIGVMLAGILYAVEGLIEYLNDPSWENFGQIIQGIGVALLGLAVIIGSVPLAVVGAIVLIVGTITKYWDEIQAFLQKGIDWLKGKSDWVHQMFGNTIGNIYDLLVNGLQGILNWFDLTFTSIKGIFDGIIKFVKGVFTGDWKLAWEGIKQVFSNIWNWIKGTANSILSGIINTAITFASTVGDVIAGVFKAVVNGVLAAVESILNFPIKAINKLIDIINAVPGIDLGLLPTFNLPRLAKGGIVNMPGRGVMSPYGNAIRGEAGAEGVIPLTDSQQMELLGEAIGKYITVNANITNTMNGRVISRELQRIQNESDFAYNR